MMAGTIVAASQTRWSAASWLFDWTLEFLAERVTDAGVAADLREVVRENLGWLAVEDFGPGAAQELRALIQRDLLTAANEQLPADLASRGEVLNLLGELVSQVSDSSTA